MPWILAFAALFETPAGLPERALPERQARASVIILRGEPIRLGEGGDRQASVVRISAVRERDGSLRTASLVEFY